MLVLGVLWFTRLPETKAVLIFYFNASVAVGGPKVVLGGRGSCLFVKSVPVVVSSDGKEFYCDVVLACFPDIVPCELWISRLVVPPSASFDVLW